jgi:hypothetical protein
MRLGVVGIDHFHTTGWIDSLEHFADRIEIVALYDPNPEMGETLRPNWADPGLRRQLDAKYRSLPFYTDLDQMIAEHRLDIALVTSLAARHARCDRQGCPGGNQPARRQAGDAHRGRMPPRSRCRAGGGRDPRSSA